MTDVPPQSNSPPGGVLGIRIAPGSRARGSRRARTRGKAFDGPPCTDATAGPRFVARIPRLVLNATGISTAARHDGRTGHRSDGRDTNAGKRARRRTDTTSRRSATRRDGSGGRKHPRPVPRVPLDRVSGETMRVVVFQGRRGDGRPRRPHVWAPDSHLCYTSACLRTMPD